MLDIFLTTQFRKDYKKLRKTNDTARLLEIVDMLRNEKELPAKYRDHALSGDYKGMRECHIAPDWLLIYRIVYNPKFFDNEISLFDKKSHSI